MEEQQQQSDGVQYLGWCVHLGLGVEVVEAGGPLSGAGCRDASVGRLCAERPCRTGHRRKVCSPCAFSYGL